MGSLSGLGKAEPGDRPAFVNMGGDVAIADESVRVHARTMRDFRRKANGREKPCVCHSGSFFLFCWSWEP